MASKAKNIVLGTSIAIIFLLFIIFGIETFYDSPKYSDFCDEGKTEKRVRTEEECNSLGGKWNPNIPRPVEVEAQEGYCDVHYTCRKEFDSVREAYNRNVFIVSGIIGIIVVIIAAIMKLPSVSSGLLGGGVLVIIQGVMRYWTELADLARFIILGVTLGILIWIGYKKLNKR